ncbi:MAG TPA: hypothetical protein VGM03_09840 [Phycisphaerae bacterium]|jgi:hypothetical protein
MPLRRRRVLARNPRSEGLRARLVEEWRQPREDVPEPIIVEESGPNKPTHLFVIWSDWGDFNQQERSEIIMDAYEEARGSDLVSLVTVAMGLTPTEAERMGIEYE